MNSCLHSVSFEADRIGPFICHERASRLNLTNREAPQ